MANTIKGLSDDGVNATVIVVGMADNVTQLIAGHQEHQPVLRGGLDASDEREELRDVIETRVARLGMDIEGNAKWKIINLSKGLPTFVHSLGKFSCYAAIDRRRLTVVEGVRPIAR